MRHTANGQPLRKENFTHFKFDNIMLCNCPAAASLTAIPCTDCPEQFGQIQKVAFQRLRGSDGKLNYWTGSTSSNSAILTLAGWQAKMAAVDSSKVVLSPYIYAPTQEGGAARTFGGGNESLGGIEEIIGAEPTTFTAQLRSEPQTTIAILKELICEAKVGNLGIYLFDEYGRIECIVKDTVQTEGSDAVPTAYPIPIRGFFVGDKIHGNLESPDSNAIQWAFPPNYSDNLKILVPTDFNPLSDLCAVEDSDSND